MSGLELSRKRVAIIVVVAAVVVLVIGLAVGLGVKGSSRSHSEPVVAKTASAIHRLDCFPEAKGNRSDVDKAVCESRGCVFDSTQDSPCFRLEMKTRFKFQQTKSTEEGLEGIISSSNDSHDPNRWVMSVQFVNNDLLRFTINSEKQDRFAVPVPLNVERRKLSDPQYDFQVTRHEDWLEFKVVRKSTGTVIWQLETEENGLILTDQLLQITTRLPSSNVYGLGEHRHDSFRHKMDTTWPAFARDQPPSYDDQANLYGVHPFYTCVEDDASGSTHGVLFFNSNAQEYAFSTNKTLTYRTIGGLLDFYIFMGSSPEDVIHQYTQMVGRPVMPPYWALGFQQCRYGYDTIDNLTRAVDSTNSYNIPHDVQYVDIDHMEARKDFTIDRKRFPGLNDYFKSLQADGMRIVYLLDPCFVASDDYEPYTVVKEAGGAIQWPRDLTVPDNVKDADGNLLGFVWPDDPVIFPDFFKTSGRNTWKKLVKDYRHNLTFDGLWIDMNEPASFGTNLEKPWNWPEDRKPYWTLHCPNNSLEDPPYRPKAAHRWDSTDRASRLSDKTICLSVVQGDKHEYRHYDVHSLFGWSQTRPTLEAAREATGERSIIITRSTFPGSGSSAGHWLGDNLSQWPDMHSSIIGMLEFNLFGIPYVGADICGFFGDVTPSLCKRWMQLGAFYPFCRNHNAIGQKDQGPGQLGDDVGKASAEILNIRYRLLPYLYTLFHLAHQMGSTVVRPVHHEFPTDTVALSLDKQFLWGACFMVAPILEENQSVLTYYKPEGKWYNYLTHEPLRGEGGEWVTVSVDANSLPALSVRGGCVLAQQQPANNTHYSRQNPFSMLIALDVLGTARGDLFWDDGVSIDTYERRDYMTVEFTVQESRLSVSVTHKVQGDPEWQRGRLDKVVVMGVTAGVTRVQEADGSKRNLTFTQANTTLTINLPTIPIVELTHITWT